ncbi:hypothetical protein OZ411_37130 [Bradyrhizobium sp. Arg237L]|uniref:hypothetical protein n=1 Tax=Bradyrhizobium sp. Arg237L TaxID=3003352 RepID=UPI00249F08A2|nr:hypothetical protein [Bradyrhizobium sp. Arg237L]MDI4238434.1 hypothetical protein [Bradyrhizobium sp. Arg237L]
MLLPGGISDRLGLLLCHRPNQNVQIPCRHFSSLRSDLAQRDTPAFLSDQFTAPAAHTGLPSGRKPRRLERPSKPAVDQRDGINEQTRAAGSSRERALPQYSPQAVDFENILVMKTLMVSKREEPPERLGHSSFGNDPKIQMPAGVYRSGNGLSSQCAHALDFDLQASP